MESKFAKVLDSGRIVALDLKRRKVPRFATYLSGASCNDVPQLSALKSSLNLGKRKKHDSYKTKCSSCKLSPRRSLIRNYTNFMKTGLPKRLMFYQNGGWVDHDMEVLGMVRKEFEHKKAAIEVKLNGGRMVFDFVRMVQFNFKTALEQSIAWIDEDGCCFFPEAYVDVDEQHGHIHYENQKDDFSSFSSRPRQESEQEIKLHIEIEVKGVNDENLEEYCGDSSPLVKRIKVGQNSGVEYSCDKVCNVRMTEDVGENQHVEKNVHLEVETKNLDLDCEKVKKMFLEGMDTISDVSVLGICSKHGSMWQGQRDLFLKQVEITRMCRGNPNVCYAWLASTKVASSGIMEHGLGHFSLQHIKSSYGIGVQLTSAKCANTSANYCDVDEKGVRYMVLCRVILGNMEVIHAGSKQFHPSSMNFDSGVDDLQNPRHYVVWSMNINTHIYPEYVVSFKVPTNTEGSYVKDDGNLGVLSIKTGGQSSMDPLKLGASLDLESVYQSNVTCDGSKERTGSVNSTTLRLPKSQWMPFPMLLNAISKQVPDGDMKLVHAHYQQFKNKVINREYFVKNLRLIVGDTLLKTTITELHSKVAPTAL